MAASEIEKLERLVRENPKGRLFASLADAYRKDGQYPKALEVLEAGLKNHPDYVSARVVLGRVQLAVGDRMKAREAFARVVELDPESVIALKALADLAEEGGEASEALRWSGQLLTVDPGNDEALKQNERLAAAVPPEPRLSGIVPMEMTELADQVAHPVDLAPERTVPAFPAITSVPTPARTVEIPAVRGPQVGPAFIASEWPLDRDPEPLPLTPLSEEAQTEQAVGKVVPMAALEPTSFEDANVGSAPTERMAGIDPVGMSAEEVAAIGATSGFEPTSGPTDVTDLPRSSVVGLESLSGELVLPGAPPTEDDGLEREVEIELGGSSSNEFQESSAAETLQRRSGANEFQVSSDADMLDASSAAVGDALDTGGADLAFIEPAPPEPMAAPRAPVFAPAPLRPEDPEPAVTEPEPVVTEAMAELYSAQGHLAEALDVYRQLAARDPGDGRYADRIVELEMFVGGAAPSVAAPVPAEGDTSLEEMELVAPPAAPRVSASGSVGRVTVGMWLADIFAEALPGVTPGASAPPAPRPAPTPAPTPIPVVEAAAVSDTAPRGAPTRQASGGFSLSNVFGEERPGAPAAKSGSFDDFFGAAAPAPASAPMSAPGGPTARSTRTSAATTPPADDDLSSFQGWLKGLKK